MKPARRIVTFDWVSADAYFAAPDGNLDWVVPDEKQAKAAAADIPNFDAVLFGRRTYEIFEKFVDRAPCDSRLRQEGGSPSDSTQLSLSESQAEAMSGCGSSFSIQ